MRIDLHTHSYFSDGTDSPTILVEKAARAHLDVISLTDHDTTDGVREAMQAGRRVGVYVLPGIEISTHWLDTEVHLLGYGIDTRQGSIASVLAHLRKSRKDRLEAMVSALQDHGIDLSMADIAAQSTHAISLGRPHIADALVAAGYAGSRDEAFARYLAKGRPAYIPRQTIGLAEAVDLVHESGGAAIIAHPGIRGNEEALKGDVIEQLVKDHHLDGLEVDYPLHDASAREFYHQLGGRLGMIRTGSSDYHGSGKVNHDLGCELTRESAWRLLALRISRYGGIVPH